MMGSDVREALPQWDVWLEEYKTLRDETLKRVDLRFRIHNLTLVALGALFTVSSSAGGQPSILLVYPILALFFAVAYVYESMMLVEIGAYLRRIEESNQIPLGWVTHLKERYRKIEPLELASSFGLFIGTQAVALFAWAQGSTSHTNVFLFRSALGATFLTVLVLLYPWLHHRAVLSRGRTG